MPGSNPFMFEPKFRSLFFPFFPIHVGHIVLSVVVFSFYTVFSRSIEMPSLEVLGMLMPLRNHACFSVSRKKKEKMDSPNVPYEYSAR